MQRGEAYLKDPGVYIVRQNDLSATRTRMINQPEAAREKVERAYSSTFSFSRNSPTWL